MNELSPILLIEDDENDAFFFERAAHKSEVQHPLRVVRDGLEATHYIAGEGQFTNREKYPLPGVIVLDLNLPQRNGLEVLQWLRGRPETRHTVVVVLTSSMAERDIEEAYGFGANSYLVKPANSERMVQIVGALKSYWLDLNVPARRAA